MHARDFVERLDDVLRREREKRVESVASGAHIGDYAKYRQCVGRIHQIDETRTMMWSELKRATRMDDDIDGDT